MSKILIVDDDEMMIMMARHILAKKYEIVTAATGAQALELFASEKPDLVLSDLLMPEIDGYELQRLLQERSAEPVPIIFMTADESEESESKGFRLGAADYIRKPLKPDVLLRRVGNIIDNLDKIRKLKVAASTDPLTGLLNKTASQSEIGACVRTATGALMMIDLDNFKLVNDLYGHAVGDKVLIHFAALIRKIIREDDLAGRMGGDEFIVFVHGVDDEKILRGKVEFLNAQILSTAKKIADADLQIPLGVSVGAVFVPDEGNDLSTLYRKADAALYSVKQNGKHGLAVFGAHGRKASAASDGKISQLRMILGERTKEPGAYVVDFDTFGKIFRLLVRMADNCKMSLTLLQFTLPADADADAFAEVLVHSLRRSDCVSQSGKKFFVLLTETSESESEIVRDKIFACCPNSLAGRIAFEREKIF